MLSFILRRVLWFVPTMWAIVTASFFLMRFAPGGPFDLERRLDPQIRKHLEAKFGMDKPLLLQYLNYLEAVARGDLGPSMVRRGRTVAEIIGEALPVSLLLGFCALAFAVISGTAMGVISAWRQNTPIDYSLMSISALGVSVPSMVLAPLLIAVFAFELGWFPVGWWGRPEHLVLPALALGSIFSARIARLTRAGVLEILQQDFVRSARAKGLSEFAVLFKHALPLGSIPVIAYLGPATASILTGSVVVEQIFYIPGIGRYFVSSALERDYTLALGTVVVYSGLLIVLNLLTEIVQCLIDPRVKPG